MPVVHMTLVYMHLDTHDWHAYMHLRHRLRAVLPLKLWPKELWPIWFWSV